MDSLPPLQSSPHRDPDAAWLLLVDGQFWGFARPALSLRPEFHHDERAGQFPSIRAVARTHVRYPPRIQDLVDRLKTIPEHADEQEQQTRFAELAISLLQQVQDIDFESALQLVTSSIEANPRLVFEILLISLGGWILPCEQPIYA